MFIQKELTFLSQGHSKSVRSLCVQSPNNLLLVLTGPAFIWKPSPVQKQ